MKTSLDHVKIGGRKWQGVRETGCCFVSAEGRRRRSVALQDEKTSYEKPRCPFNYSRLYIFGEQ
ncbi:MAG: hypothetical protein HY360_25475 [Verrucomicrobia bacterium]|nr:hypothetical protein [Verrucomicrobiota bacterium]